MNKDNAQLSVLMTIMSGVVALVYLLHLIALWLANQSGDEGLAQRAVDTNNSYHDAVGKFIAQIEENTDDTH